MLRITFHEPVHVRDKDLCAFFNLMDSPARVKIEQIAPSPVNSAEMPKRRGRPPRAEAPPVTIVAAAVAAAVESPESPEPVTEAPKRRGRPPKAVAAAPASVAEEPKRRGRPPKAVVTPPAPIAAVPEPASNSGSGNGGLAKRFSALVDTDYEAALELLEDFGANSFTEVKPEDIDEFDKALAELEEEAEEEEEEESEAA